MSRIALALSFLLAAGASQAVAQDLRGYYRVTGDLPGPGGAYDGVAAFSPSSATSYRVRVVGRTAEGRALKLSGIGRRTGGGFEVRYQNLGSGLTGVLIGGPASLQGLVGRYQVGADGTVSGRLTATGATPAGRSSYAKQATPALTFEPATLEVASGQPVTATVRGPAEALALLTIGGPGDGRVKGTGATRVVNVTGLEAGDHVITAHVGTTRGVVAARLQVVVRAPEVTRITDIVAKEVERVAAAGQTPVVIFDLDDTLFETRTRSSTIIREYGEQIGNETLEGAKYEHVRFGLEQTLANVGLTQAEITGDLGRQVRRFWSPRFFNGSHYHHDTALPGSVAYVNRLEGLGAKIVYLTGRKTVARDPSIAAIRAAGFPWDATTVLFVKPDTVPGQPKLDTPEWKGRTAKDEIMLMGTVVAAFDNEPGNCNALHEALPSSCHIVFLDTLYAEDAPDVVDGVPAITDYE